MDWLFTLIDLEKGISLVSLIKAQNSIQIQYTIIFKNTQVLTLQWSRIYWSWMKCVQFYLFSLFVWLAIFVFVCLIIRIIKAQTEVAIRRTIALESTLFAWWLKHLFLGWYRMVVLVLQSTMCPELIACQLCIDNILCWPHRQNYICI